MRVNNLIGFVFSSLANGGAFVICVSLGTMFITLLVNVILRYGFGSGLTWAYELPLILFPWTVAGGLVVASVQGRHIAVDVLVRKIPSHLSRLYVLAINLINGAVAFVVAFYSLPVVEASQYTKLAHTGISQLYGYASITFTFLLIGIVCVTAAVEQVFQIFQKVES